MIPIEIHTKKDHYGINYYEANARLTELIDKTQETLQRLGFEPAKIDVAVIDNGDGLIRFEVKAYACGVVSETSHTPISDDVAKRLQAVGIDPEKWLALGPSGKSLQDQGGLTSTGGTGQDG